MTYSHCHSPFSSAHLWPGQAYIQLTQRQRGPFPGCQKCRGPQTFTTPSSALKVGEKSAFNDRMDGKVNKKMVMVYRNSFSDERCQSSWKKIKEPIPESHQVRRNRVTTHVTSGCQNKKENQFSTRHSTNP